MAEEPVDRPALSSAEEADLLEYGAISPVAVGALLLGLLSFLALSQLLLLIVPLLAVLTALLALRQIARSEGALVGRTAAIGGLALALAFASFALAGAATRSWKLNAEARSFGDAWLELVRKGQLQRAHQLHLPAADRQLPGSSLPQFYATGNEARAELEQFFAAPPLSEIAAAGENGLLVFRDAETSTYDDIEHVAMRYTFGSYDYTFGNTEFVLVVERAPTDAGAVWRALGATPVPDDATR